MVVFGTQNIVLTESCIAFTQYWRQKIISGAVGSWGLSVLCMLPITYFKEIHKIISNQYLHFSKND